ncbi:MAG: 4-(cytidine 5'-diphospho)-2-C-methyl-D-erythritol kinase [Pseudanabaena sp. ELA607]|jgi:4-diphosphocytidyl-2-C-methyl-D-erythritol kinase
MTKVISLKAAAKVNLYLEITGSRADGYHDLVMVLQSIALWDRIDVRSQSSERITLVCDHPEVPLDETNLAYRAAALLRQHFPQVGGMEITIDKQIPIGGGLAGGSSNAAAVLVAIDRLWELGLTQPELCDFAAQLGSDIPFCVVGGTALATGRGEILSPLPDIEGMALLICKPEGVAVSTPWAYKTFRAEGLLAKSPIKDQHFSKGMITAISERAKLVSKSSHDPIEKLDYHGAESHIAAHLYNDLERVVLPAYPQISAVKEKLLGFVGDGCLGAMMSGSGATVFGIAENLDAAARIAESIRSDTVRVWVTQTTNRAIEEVL